MCSLADELPHPGVECCLIILRVPHLAEVFQVAFRHVRRKQFRVHSDLGDEPMNRHEFSWHWDTPVLLPGLPTPRLLSRSEKIEGKDAKKDDATDSLIMACKQGDACDKACWPYYQ
jgi:hypothetical protein